MARRRASPNRLSTMFVDWGFVGGTHPLAFHNHQIKVKFIYVAYTVFVSIPMLYCMWQLSIIYRKFPIPLLINAYFGSLFMPITTYFLLLFFNILYLNNINEYIQITYTTDRALESRGIFLCVNNKFYMESIIIIAVMKQLTIFIELKVNVISFFYFHILAVSFFFETGIVSTYMNNVSIRIEALTKKLLEVEGCQDRCKTTEMLWLVSGYCSLRRGAVVLKSAIALRLLLLITFLFIAFTQNVYGLSIQILAEMGLDKDNETWKFFKKSSSARLYERFFWPLIYLLLAFQLGQHASRLDYQIKNFKRELYYILLKAKTLDLLYNDKVTLPILKKQEVKFTANGMFCVDKQLIYSMIVSTTTFLVVLIQFDKS